MIEEMFIKIEEQRKEIDQRNITLAAIQRNFESLSQICKSEKQNSYDMQKKLNYLQEDNLKLINTNQNLNEKFNKKTPLNSLIFFFCMFRIEEIIKNNKEKDKNIDILNEEKKKLKNLLNENMNLKEKIEKIEKENIKKNNNLNQKEKEYKEINFQNENLMQKLKEFEKNNELFTNIQTEKEKEINYLKDEISNLTSMNFNYKNLIEEYEDDKKDNEIQINELKNKIKELEKNIKVY